MILGFDVGNTHICPIVYNDNGEILEKFRIPSKILFTEDTLFSTLKTLFDSKNIKFEDIKDMLISSVVPYLDEIFIYFSRKYLKKEAIILSAETVDENLLKIKDLAQRKLGADRIATIIAMQNRIKDRNCIIIDFGTATTFEVIFNNNYLGGAILPGIELSINALFQNTAKLPKVSFSKPDEILANTTESQINMGIFYGNIGAIKEIISEFKKLVKDPYIVATGGQGKKISENISEINEYIPNLAEEGIYLFYKYITK